LLCFSAAAARWWPARKKGGSGRGFREAGNATGLEVSAVLQGGASSSACPPQPTNQPLAFLAARVVGLGLGRFLVPPQRVVELLRA
jgi:hypothetical protein